MLAVLFEEQLGRGHDDLVALQLPGSQPQRLEDAGEIRSSEARTGAEAELRLDIGLVVQEHAARGPAVPPRSPALL